MIAWPRTSYVAFILATACGSSSTSNDVSPDAGTEVEAAPAPVPVPVTTKPAVATSKKSVAGSLTTPDGRKRTYHVYVPDSLSANRKVPLLVALHGGVGTGMQFEANSDLDGIAEANQFIVVYPDGIPLGGTSVLGRGQTWNGGGCCGSAAAQEVDDVKFVAMVVEEMEKRHSIDETRVYATGHSNGAIFAYRLACELADEIVAIGVQAGSLEIPSCKPSKPVSVLHIHGGADTNIPLGGGKGDGISGFVFHSPEDAVATLAKADGCPKDSTSAVSKDNPDVTTETWRPCRDETEVRFDVVAGASHAWMGHEGTRAVQTLAGPPYMELDSSAAIWAFLAAHPRR